MVEFLYWIHEGAGLDFWTQVYIKSGVLLCLVLLLFFGPDTTFVRKFWPVRFARMYLAIASLILLADYYSDGYAKHLMIANFFLGTVFVIVANRLAARQIIKEYHITEREISAP